VLKIEISRNARQRMQGEPGNFTEFLLPISAFAIPSTQNLSIKSVIRATNLMRHSIRLLSLSWEALVQTIVKSIFNISVSLTTVQVMNALYRYPILNFRLWKSRRRNSDNYR